MSVLLYTRLVCLATFVVWYTCQVFACLCDSISTYLATLTFRHTSECWWAVLTKGTCLLVKYIWIVGSQQQSHCSDFISTEILVSSYIYAPFTDSWRETDMWPVFVESCYWHDVASSRKWKMFIKYTSCRNVTF